MKKLLILILSLSLIAFVSLVNADISKTLKFTWDQDAATLEILDHWELYWSDVSGGPYVKAATIPYDGETSGSYEADEPLTVTGKIGQDTVKYFVLIACSTTECSADSNEVSYNFGVLPPGAPFNFTVEVVVQ